MLLLILFEFVDNLIDNLFISIDDFGFVILTNSNIDVA